MTDQTAQQLRQQITELVGRYAELELAAPGFVPGQHAVPPSGKVIGAPELQAMTEAVLDGWLTTGRFNQAFENAWHVIWGGVACSPPTPALRRTCWRFPP